MKQIRLFAALLMVALVVTSCITWEDEEGGSSGNSQGGKRLSRMIFDSGDWEGDFNYQNGKLIKIKYKDDYGHFGEVNFTYSGTTVTIDDHIMDSKQILELNRDGFVESGLIIDGSDTWTFNCKYSNGYLTEINIPNPPPDYFFYSYRFPYEFGTSRIEYKYDNNGNILVVNEVGKNNKIIRENKITSSNNPTKGKPNFFLFGIYSNDPCPFWWAYLAGFFGKDAKNLVSKMEVSDFYDDYYGDTYSVWDVIFNYTLYNDGYVQKMNFYENYRDGYSYSPDDGIWYAFTYE